MMKKGIHYARSGLYHPARVDGVQHVLSRTEITQSCSNYHFLYIFLLRAGHLNAMLTAAEAHTVLSKYLLYTCASASRCTLDL